MPNDLSAQLAAARAVVDNRCMPVRGPQELYGRKLVPIEKDIVTVLYDVAEAAMRVHGHGFDHGLDPHPNFTRGQCDICKALAALSAALLEPS